MIFRCFKVNSYNEKLSFCEGHFDNALSYFFADVAYVLPHNTSILRNSCSCSTDWNWDFSLFHHFQELWVLLDKPSFRKCRFLLDEMQLLWQGHHDLFLVRCCWWLEPLLALIQSLPLYRAIHRLGNYPLLFQRLAPGTQLPLPAALLAKFFNCFLIVFIVRLNIL